MTLSFSEAASQAVQGAACSLLALSDEGTRWINSAIGADGDFGNIAGALRKRICNESSPDTTDFGPEIPFVGGQCDCARYEVLISINRQPSGEIQNAGRWRTRGPISRIYVASNGQLRGISKAGWSSDQFSYPTCGVSGDRRIDFNLWGGDSFVNSVTVTESPDGDDCGDPQGDPVGDYNDFSTTVSITYTDESSTEITEDIDINLGPLIVGIGGILYAPVTVGTGDITFNGTLKLAPEISVDLFPDGLFGGGGNTDDPAPSPGRPDPTPTPPDDRRRIIGAIVTVTNFDESIAKVTQVAQGDSPDIFVPRTGNVSFYVDTPGGQAWTEPKPLRNIREYVPCPAREGAVDVAVTAGTGFTLAVTPVYADLALV